MTKDDPSGARTDANPDNNPAGPRKSRTIRFSDSEWKQVESAAKRNAMTAAQFVRDAATLAAQDNSAQDSGAIPPGTYALIQSTYRYAYILATLKRNEFIRERRGDEVDELIQAARKSQALLLKQATE